MVEATKNLGDWMARLSKARSREEIFAILDEFRALDWSDDERARVAKHYIRLMDQIGSGEAQDEADVQQQGGDDGPVWYERM